MPLPQPSVIGNRRSFGFGDRLGCATPGHVAAARGWGFVPVFAQQSIREMARTQRTPEEVMRAAQSALASEGYEGVWGADADHLKTPEDVAITAAAGFRFFTIDPSAFVENHADAMPAAELAAHLERLRRDHVLPAPQVIDGYRDREFDLGPAGPIRLTAEALDRAFVKYGRVLAHIASMADVIRRENGNRPYEIEVSVDESESPTQPSEHLVIALELKRRGVPVASLAPRFVGQFEKGIDYKGDREVFARQLETHVAIARQFGPYKISIHSGSDKFSIYPIIGQKCGELLHVKTAGTSYLEALRVVCRRDSDLFGEIAQYSVGRFAADRATYHISTTEAEVGSAARSSPADWEEIFLNQRPGRQLLHVTFGSVLTKGVRANGQPFKEAILQALARHESLHRELLEHHLGRHLALLSQG